MRIRKDLFGEDFVLYDSLAEEDAAINAYLAGEWSRLTRLQIREFKEAESDPYQVRWNAAHAGQFASNVDPLDFNGLIVVYNLGRTFEEGRQQLLRMLGPRPITRSAIINLSTRLRRRLVSEARETRENSDSPADPLTRQPSNNQKQ